VRLLPSATQLTPAQLERLLSGVPPDKWVIIDVKVMGEPRLVAILQTEEGALDFAKHHGGVIVPTTSSRK
jgi:hypothetical protein